MQPDAGRQCVRQRPSTKRWRWFALGFAGVLLLLFLAAVGLFAYDSRLKLASIQTLQKAAASTDPGALEVLDPCSGRKYCFRDLTVRTRLTGEEVEAYAPLCDSPVEWLYRLVGRSGRGGCIAFTDGHGVWYREQEYRRVLERNGILSER
jgi:hypothetical protein